MCRVGECCTRAAGDLRAGPCVANDYMHQNRQYADREEDTKQSAGTQVAVLRLHGGRNGTGFL